MTKYVLDVGNCGPDHGSIRSLIESVFDAVVHQSHEWEDTLAALRSTSYHLVLVNRILDRSGEPGLKIIQRIRSQPAFRDLPVMMITNFPEFQAQAVAAGAAFGFGKAELDKPETIEKLAQFLNAQE